jgi:hypothetical protein
MNKSLIFTALFGITSLLAFTACEKTDNTSIVPQFSSITCQPEKPAAGDSITLTAHQSVRGHLINSTTYRWAFTYIDGTTFNDTTVVRNVEVVYDAVDGADPQVGFRIPADTPSNKLTVSLTALYSLSGQTATGQIFGQAARSTSITLAQ